MPENTLSINIVSDGSIFFFFLAVGQNLIFSPAEEKTKPGPCGHHDLGFRSALN